MLGSAASTGWLRERRKLMAVQLNEAKFNAGLVFVLARALQRRIPEHIAIEQAAYWLRSHGYDRQADELDDLTSQKLVGPDCPAAIVSPEHHRR